MNKLKKINKQQRRMVYFSILGKSIMILWKKYYFINKKQMVLAHLYTSDKYQQTMKGFELQ